MADLRIFSYLPNPRLYKATIAARFSGAVIEVLGASPKQMPGWLWDYHGHPLAEGDAERYAEFARQAKTGFSGTLYKTDAFLAANPFGDIPAAFGAGGEVGVFESNSILRAAARLGPKGGELCGEGPLLQSRIDGFLDRSLLFARSIQQYLLADRKAFPKEIHQEMASALASYLGGIDQALSSSRNIACDELSLADIAFACELALFSNELFMKEALERAGLPALVPRIDDFGRVKRHLATLAADERFAEDLGSYLDRIL